MQLSPGPRKTANLSQSVRKQLNMYAMAASAAGVGILVGAQLVEAKIIYTPADIHINVNGGLVKLDLNHDGITDALFKATYHHNAKTLIGRLTMYDPFTNSLFGFVPVVSRNLVCAAALPKGRRIGKGTGFQGGADGPMASGGYATFAGSSSGGPWKSSAKRGYLGLRFNIKGKAHYAWVRVERVDSSKRFHYPAVITGYAYETIAGKGIVAGATKDTDESNIQQPDAALSTPTSDTPQPATLGALALGAHGLSIWRRDEEAIGQ
jgi:hypothetical protein